VAYREHMVLIIFSRAHNNETTPGVPTYTREKSKRKEVKPPDVKRYYNTE
jgi:hypothetical protein